MSETHEMMGGKLKLYRRPGSPYWQCATFMNGRNHRESTREDSLAAAKDVAEDWYLELRGLARAGILKSAEKTFNDAADVFEAEYEIITKGERNPQYVEGHKMRLRVHLRPFMGNKPLSECHGGLFQEYRVNRYKKNEEAKKSRPSRSVLHHETVTARLVLKAAVRKGWLSALPDISEPYKASSKISHRAWFSPTEYRSLYLATRERAAGASPVNGRWKWERQQFHDYVLFMANTGLRPDESARLQFRDVKIVNDEDSGETILEIEVRGKRGTGFCKSTTGAVLPFKRMRDRLRTRTIPPEHPGGKATKVEAKPEPTDLLFPGNSPRELMNLVLGELNLKQDREGRTRTCYSLRHTYISFRLLERADIYQLAKNCRTSVEMIEKFYAAHLKTQLDAAAINVRRSKDGRTKGLSMEDLAGRLMKLEAGKGRISHARHRS